MSVQTGNRFLDRSTPPHIFTLILMAGMSALVMNIFLPSLPAMTEYYQTEYRTIQLSVALYLGASAVLQLFIGPISDKMGRRPVILAGLVLFVLASLGCVLAPTVSVFLAFRMCQAVIVVCMVLGRAALRDMYDQDQAASMLGYVTMGMAVVPMVGPAIGGVLDEAFGWASNFWLLVALGVLTLVLAVKDFGETAVGSGKTLTEQFREYPELLRSPRFWGYSMAAALSSGSFYSYLGGAPFVGTEVYGLSSVELGLFFGAPAIGYFFGNFLTGRYATRYGINRMVLWGGYTLCAGLSLNVVITALGAGSAYSYFGLMTAVGAGNGLSMPNAIAGSLSVRPHLAGTASGLGGALMLGGGAALSAMTGAVLTPDGGEMTLLLIMLTTSVLCVISMFLVIRRERRLGL